MEPDVFGFVLSKQYENLEEPIYHFLERDDNYIHHFPTLYYFSNYEDWPKDEQNLIDMASGIVLDVGCGAGRHALHLQNKGLKVIGMDVSERLLYICQKRGLKHTVFGSILEIDKLQLQEKIDTIIIMGNNLPLCYSEEKMLKTLNDCYNLSSENGILLANFITATPTNKAVHLQYHENNLKKGKRKGEVRFRIRYENMVEDWFKFYLPTFNEFETIIEKTDWQITEITTDGNRHCVKLGK